jgi:thymidylate kinase
MRAEDAELLGRVPWSLRAANGIPKPEQVVARERAAALASDALADLLLPGGVRTSPLGPGWSRDIDLYLLAWPEPARLEALGWIPLDSLLHSLRIPSRGRWAVMEDGQVLAGLDLYLDPPPNPVASLLSRCRRRSEVRVREVLEARALLREGYALPADDPVICIAAQVEAGLGGQDLAPWKDGPVLYAPVSLRGHRIHQLWANVRSAQRPRLVVALSGVDGSGKSTLSQLVARNLHLADVPASHVWARPGMGIGREWLGVVARVGKKLLGQDLSPGVERIAGGAPVGALTSRRGLIGWIWTMLVTLSFLMDVRRQHVRGRGVLLYDRHLLDALVTLDFVYGGVNLRVHRAMIRRSLPKAKLSVYLDVPAEVALARKPGDMFGEYAVRRQLEGYESCLSEMEDLRRLDGNRGADELAAIVTRWLAEL